MEEIGIKEYIILALFGALYGIWQYIANKLDNKIDKEIKNREDREKGHEEDCDKCKERILLAVKEANKEWLLNFQEGLRTEREFRLGVMNEQRVNIARLFERLDELSILMTDIKATQEDSIIHQKEICALRHKKD